MHQHTADRGASKKAHKQEKVNKKKNICCLIYCGYIQTYSGNSEGGYVCESPVHSFITSIHHSQTTLHTKNNTLFPLCVKLIHNHSLFELFLKIVFL